MPRARARIDDRPAGRVGDHPVEQPGLEGQPLQLVDEVGGVGGGDGVVRRPHLGVAPVRAAGDDGVPVDRRRWGGRDLLRDRSEPVDPAPVLLPGLPLQLVHQRLRTLRHPAQARLDLAPVGEGVQPLGAGAQLTRSLRAAQQQHGQQRALVRLEPELLVEDLVVLQGPPAGV